MGQKGRELYALDELSMITCRSQELFFPHCSERGATSLAA